MTREQNNESVSFLPEGQDSTAMSVENWDQVYNTLTQLTQPTQEKPFTFWKDDKENVYKVNFQNQSDANIGSSEPRQRFVNIVRVTEDEMAKWLE